MTNSLNKEMKKFKLGFGPMSKEITKILANYSKENNYPLMIIASRNQVDYNSGYVCNTTQLAELLKEFAHENLLVCRDHCGPYFSDSDNGLGLDQAVEQCKRTIACDVENKFDLIHIDVGRVPVDMQTQVATELIEYALQLNPDVMLEFGSEDNFSANLNQTANKLDFWLEFLAPYKNNVKFVVTPTGSLTKDRQVGYFKVEQNKSVAEKIHAAGFLFKEHNADYFSAADIQLRTQAGVDALNIAPQLGAVQTRVLKELAPTDLWEKFAQLVYSKNYWQRWVSDSAAGVDHAVLASGHYLFDSDEYRAIVQAIDAEQFRSKLAAAIKAVLELYITFDKDFDLEEAKFQAVLRARLEELRKRDPFIYR